MIPMLEFLCFLDIPIQQIHVSTFICRHIDLIEQHNLVPMFDFCRHS